MCHVILSLWFHSGNLFLEDQVPNSNDEVFGARNKLKGINLWEENKFLNDSSVADEIVGLKVFLNVENFDLTV
jgi:hypothetical protein